MTTTFSDNLETRIINELMFAQQSIKIAVAWFNSKNILNILCWKLRGGVAVELILHFDEINSGSESSLDYTEYKRLGGILIWAKGEKSTMHVKFCIIDDKVLLHGSCNWTYRAFKKNDEVLNVTTNESEMTSSYLSTFFSLKEKYNSPISPFNKSNYSMQTKKKDFHKNESNIAIYNTPSIDERKQLFLQALQPFESKYDRDYIRTFTEYWLTENMGKLRFEMEENGQTMNSPLNITLEVMNMKLENWESKYNIILLERQSKIILDEIMNKIELMDKEYEENDIILRCREINYRQVSEGISLTSDRLFGKLLFDSGFELKSDYEYDRFLQRTTLIHLCYPITNIEEGEEKAFSDFCLLYEANQAFKQNKEYNRGALALINPEHTYKSFCDKYGVKYGSNLKQDKSITEMVSSMKFPFQIKYSYGTISLGINHTSHRKLLLKLNEIFGLELLIGNWFLPTNIPVPNKVLYQMDGKQFDFRDDSFENGTMKSIKLPTKYRGVQFYIDKIEEMLRTR